ncbi:MAG TPA: hypothetical protein VK960_03895 [Acidimicrobiia bacterium]|nr:hypothetical protein [Acidimicrobiia bacterium]
MMTGLEPRDFTWVISDRLAVSERIGGHGAQHRRVRREEEIAWLKNAGVTAVLSLLEGNQNIAAYQAAEIEAHNEPLNDLEPGSVGRVFKKMQEIAAKPGTVLLVHRDIVDDAVAGVLAGYLVHSGRVEDPIVATDIVQRILKRPLGPEARAIIPESTGA